MTDFVKPATHHYVVAICHARRVAVAAVTSAVLLLSACASDDPHRRTRQGALAGAAAGAAIGSQSDDKDTLIYATVVGGLLGTVVGNYMDSQQREVENALHQEMENQNVEIHRLQDETLKISLNSSTSFDVNSFEVKPAFYPLLGKLSRLMNKYEKTAIHVIGHTDSTGNDERNRMLSQQRAAAVATVILDTGINRSRFNIEGRGEFQPRKTNKTAAGRQANRRVEIYLKPIVEGQEQQAFRPPARRT